MVETITAAGTAPGLLTAHRLAAIAMWLSPVEGVEVGVDARHVSLVAQAEDVHLVLISSPCRDCRRVSRAVTCSRYALGMLRIEPLRVSTLRA